MKLTVQVECEEWEAPLAVANALIEAAERLKHLPSPDCIAKNPKSTLAEQPRMGFQKHPQKAHKPVP